MTSEIEDAVRRALASVDQEGPDGSWSPERGRLASDRLAADGWPTVGVPEHAGGSGGTARDMAEVLRTVTRLGWPSALADAGLVTGHVATLLHACLPRTARCVLSLPVPGRLDDAGRVDVVARDVPWAGWASHFLVVCPASAGGCVAALLDAESVDRTPGVTVAGAPRGHVHAESATPVWRAEGSLGSEEMCGEIHAAGAFVRAMQMSAALGRVVDLSAHYSTQRAQFGRRLADFQAVQQYLATIAGEAAAAEAAVDRVLERWPGPGSRLDGVDVAVAKVRTSVAVDRAVPLAHQVHGAIGITREYELHRHSLNLWSWREEYGDERWWAELIIRDLAASGTDVWAWLAPD